MRLVGMVSVLGFTLACMGTPTDEPSNDAASAEATEPKGLSAELTKRMGTYARPHAVADGQAMDCLVLTDGGDGTVDFAFRLEFANGHTCEMSGKASTDVPGLLRFTEDACALDIRLRPDTLQLLDPTDACRKASCGARGHIDEIAFPAAGEASPDTALCGL